MANYETVYKTNYFHVTDEDKYRALMAGFCGEDFNELASRAKDGSVMHGFGGYNGVNYYIPASSSLKVKKLREEGAQLLDEDGNPLSEERLDEAENIFIRQENSLRHVWSRFEEDPDIYDFAKEIQELLPASECFIFMEVGNEKIRYLSGYALVATRDQIKEFNLQDLVEEAAKEMLNGVTNASI